MQDKTEEEEILEKLNDISARAQELKKKSNIDSPAEQNAHIPVKSEEERKGAQAGSEFLASVFGGAIIGYGIDWLFSSTPWGMIVFIILGFISGTYRANATMQANEEKSAKE